MIKLYKLETANITVTDGSISNGTGLSVTVSAGTATSLSLSAATTTPTAGAGDNLTITALDAGGNTATSYTGDKSLTFGGANSVGTNTPTVSDKTGAAVNLGTATTITFASGVSTVQTGGKNGVMTLYKAETANITVTDLSISNGAGMSVTVSAATASTLAFSTQPGSATAGSAFGQQPAVKTHDTFGNNSTVGLGTARNVTISIASGTGTLQGTATLDIGTSAGNGTVTFTNLRIDSAGAKTLQATAAAGSPTLANATSNSFTVSAGTATTIAIVSGSGQSATASTAFASPLVALVTDGFSNPISGASVTFAGPSTGASGTFAASGCTSNPQTYQCVATTNASGDATSSTFTANATAGSYNVSASAPGTNTVSFVMTNTAAPNKLVITSTAVSGSTSNNANLGPITVQQQTGSGTPVNAGGGGLTVNLSGPAGSSFATSQFGSAVTSVTIPSGSSSTTFFYGNTNTGSPTITAAATGLTSGTQQETITTAPAGLGIVVTGGTGTPSASCGTPGASYTCNVTGVGSGGSVTFEVTFVTSTGTQIVYSATQSSTITEAGNNSGSVTIAANASSSHPSSLTASHSGSATKTSTLTFGPFTLTINVSS